MGRARRESPHSGSHPALTLLLPPVAFAVLGSSRYFVVWRGGFGDGGHPRRRTVTNGSRRQRALRLDPRGLPLGTLQRRLRAELWAPLPFAHQ